MLIPLCSHWQCSLSPIPLPAWATHERGHGNAPDVTVSFFFFFLLNITLILAYYLQRGRSHPSHRTIDDEDDALHNKVSHARSQHRAHSSRSHKEDLVAVDEAAQSNNSDLGDDAPHNDISQSHSQHIYSTRNDDLDPMDDVSHNNASHGPSCTPSRGDAALKRRASSESLKETKFQRTSSGRPKAADYDDSDKALILLAISHYRTELGTVTAFPDIAKGAEMLGQVWQDACMCLDISVPITPQIAKLVSFLTPASVCHC